MSILKTGSPHSPHTHFEEELIIILGGSAGIITSTDGGIFRASDPTGPGSFVYHKSNEPHTICAAGPDPAVYICLKWTGMMNKKREDSLKSGIFAADFKVDETSCFQTTTIFESSTDFLTRLHCHVSVVGPGGGYEPHTDRHDVVIILLDGTIETLGEKLEPKSIIFYRAGEPHGIRNVGKSPAHYLVFEFHGSRRTVDCFGVPKLSRLWGH